MRGRRGEGVRAGSPGSGCAVLSFVGIALVFVTVAVGLELGGGELAALWQPAEMLVIVGVALGAQLIAQPPRVLWQTLQQLAAIGRRAPGTAHYLELLAMLNALFSYARKEGLVSLEPHIQDPAASPILSGYPRILADEHARSFLTDTLELVTAGGTVNSGDFDSLLDLDIEARYEHDLEPSRVLSTMADALPGIGIVAAVLGIIVAMNRIDGPPAEIGRAVAGALTGTLLGVLLSYGLVQGLATNLGNRAAARRTFLVAQKQVMVAIQRGASPSMAVEIARRSLPNDVRPSGRALLEACRARR